MQITINDQQIKLNNREVKQAKKLVSEFLYKTEGICQKRHTMSLYFTVVILMQVISQKILDEYEEDSLKQIMEELTTKN